MNYKAIIKRQSTVIAIAVICLTLATIGVSFALFFQVETNTNNQVVTAGTLNVEYGSGSSAISATELVPMSDDEALASNTMTGTIYVENKGTLPASYEVALGNDTENFNNKSNALETDELLNHDYIKVAAYLNGTMVVEPTTLSELKASENSAEMYKLFTGSLDTTGSGNSTMTVVIKVWVDENAPEDIIGDFVYLKMDITSEVMEGNLKSTIIKHASENGYLYSEAPDFSTATVDGEYGLYTAADDYGLSYYFRGDVTNNYVQFGAYASGSTVNGTTYTKETPMYWRIVRINGDGTIRLIYDGTAKSVNGAQHANATIGTTAFNSDRSDAKYAGYTYDDGSGNQIDSAIKTIVDTWYDEHLENNYSSYIADAIFCNDREITKEAFMTKYYGAYSRLITNNNPQLTCTQDADKYTVSSANGNGMLANPIALITADEAYMAGGIIYASDVSNTTYWLYSSLRSYSMSPGYGGTTCIIDYSQGTTTCSISRTQENNVRPVINIKADVEFIGNGTIDDPYQIKELTE